MSFLSQRLSPTRVTGLPVTVLVIATAYFALLYIGTMLNIFRDSRIIQFDVWLSEALSGFRSPPVLRVFGIATAFGYWAVVMAMALAVSCQLWLNDRQRYLPGLWIALAGNQITVHVLKIIFERTRPALAYYPEASFSFPSGHAAVSAAFFGFVTCMLIRERVVGTLMPRAGGLFAILLVGTSRLVLGEHYLSDVVNGYLVGGLWAWFGMWLVTHNGTGPAATPVRSPVWHLFVGLAILVLTTVGIWMLAADYLATKTIIAPVAAAP